MTRCVHSIDNSRVSEVDPWCGVKSVTMLFQKKLGDQILSAILEISFDIQPEELEETFLTPDCILIEMHIGKRGKTDMV